MTYCIGMLLDAGLVMISDTRTNAGVDNISSYKKLHTLADAPDRHIFACTSGSLSISQSVIGLLAEGLPAEEEGGPPRTLDTAATMFRAAQLVSEAVLQISATVGTALRKAKVSNAVGFLLGGRIGAERPALFLFYSAGNFIECTPETPFFQIGELKYGKPILDRGISVATPLDEAVKVGLLSFDAAMKSNLSISRPLDVMVLPSDPDTPILTRRIGTDDAYFDDLSSAWDKLLLDATRAIPNPPFVAA